MHANVELYENMEEFVRTAYAALALAMSPLVTTPAIAETRQAVSVPVAGGRSLSGELFLPDGIVNAPGVMVLHTAAGSVESFDSDYARALAKEGFVALALNFLQWRKSSSDSSLPHR